MKRTEFGMWNYSNQRALINVGVPAIHIRVVVMITDMTRFPDKAIGTHSIEQAGIYIVGTSTVKNGMMHRIMNNIEVI